MAKHFPLSPSGSGRWLTCPGSIPLCDGLPEQTSPYAEEGTLAHDLADQCLKEGIDAVGTEFTAGHKDDVIPEDMLPAIQVYLDFLRDEVIGKYKYLKWETEMLLESREIDNFGGTVDFHATYDDDGRQILHVVDYKHGAGMPVAVENNPQLLCYLLLARERYDDPFHLYRATIVQPRISSEIETVEYGFEDLAEFKANILGIIGSETLVSGDHCRWCKALTECPKVAAEALEAAKHDFADDDPKDRVQVWSNLMAAAPAIKKLLTDLPNRMVEEMRKGVKFPGCKAIKQLGNRKWGVPEAEVVDKLKRAKGIKLDEFYPRKLATPTQVDKLGHAEKIAEFVVREDRGYTCVLESARGKAVDLSPTEDDDLDFDFLD